MDQFCSTLDEMSVDRSRLQDTVKIYKEQDQS